MGHIGWSVLLMFDTEYKVRKLKKITNAFLVSCKENDTELNDKEIKYICMTHDQNT
jgi:hypothetical protein